MCVCVCVCVCVCTFEGGAHRAQCCFNTTVTLCMLTALPVPIKGPSCFPIISGFSVNRALCVALPFILGVLQQKGQRRYNLPHCRDSHKTPRMTTTAQSSCYSAGSGRRCGTCHVLAFVLCINLSFCLIRHILRGL